MLLATILSAVLATSSIDDEDDFYVCNSTLGAICKIDNETLDMTLWVSGVGQLLYGEWKDGHLYVPDRFFDAIWKIDLAGNVDLLTIGGFLAEPATCLALDDGSFLVTDLINSDIVHVQPNGVQSIFASDPLLVGTSGIALGDDDHYYVSNNVGNTLVKIDMSGNVSLVSDDPLFNAPAGLQIDGSENIFVNAYEGDGVVRVLPDGTVEEFASGPLFDGPNDIKLTKDGLMVTNSWTGNLVVIDAAGNTTEVVAHPDIDHWSGISIPEATPLSTGRFHRYGAGTPGTGGVVPQFFGVYSPGPGRRVGLESRDALGGSSGVILWGLFEGAIPYADGEFYVNFAGPFGFIPIFHDGAGAGDGRAVLQWNVLDDPAVIGLSVYYQSLILDPAATKGIALTNGIEMAIGN